MTLSDALTHGQFDARQVARATPSGTGTRWRYTVTPRTGAAPRTIQLAQLRYCLLRVVVDGQPREPGDSLDLIEPDAVHGVEVYVGPGTVRSQYAAFGRDSNCGIILIGTR